MFYIPRHSYGMDDAKIGGEWSEMVASVDTIMI